MNKTLTPVIALALSLVSSASTQAEDRFLSVIPRPIKLAAGQGEFLLTPETTIIAAKSARGEGEYLAEYLAPATGFQLAVREPTAPNDQPGGSGSIILRLVADREDLGDEGYLLQVQTDRVVVEALAPAGLFYGIQTIRQLLPAELESVEKVAAVTWSIPVVTIEDKPRFSWRGLMLDTGRVYHPPSRPGRSRLVPSGAARVGRLFKPPGRPPHPHEQAWDQPVSFDP